MTQRTGVASSRLRTKTFALLGAALLFLLTACGAKIDTVFTIDENGAGTREITLTLTQDDTTKDSIKGGVEAVEASIKKHLPTEIEFLDLTTEGDVVTAKFVIEFANIDEYVTKAKALLAAGNNQWSDSNRHVVEQNQLLNGVAIDEQFSSQRLMDWLFNGLIADKVVEESLRGSLSEDGDTTVIFGEKKESVYAHIDFDAIDDLGFDQISMQTDVTASPMTRSITFLVKDRSQVIANQEAYDKYFESITTDQIAISQGSADVGQAWIATFSGEAEDILAATSSALNSDNVVFNLKTVPNPDNPAVLQTTINNYAECGSVCSREASSVSDAISVPANPGDDYYGEEGRVVELEFWSADDFTPVTFETAASFTSVNYSLAITPEGPVGLEAVFQADKATAEQFGEGFVALIKGKSDLEVGTKEAKDVVTYTLKLEADSAKDFTKQYSAWSDSDSYVTGEPTYEDSFFKTSFRHDGSLELPYRFNQNLPAGSTSVVTVTSVGRAKIVEDLYPSEYLVSVDGNTATFESTGYLNFTLEVQGRTIGGIIVLGGIGVVFLGAIVGLTLFIRKNKDKPGVSYEAPGSQAPLGQEQGTPPPPQA